MKIFNYILAFISVGVLMASCSQEEEFINQGDDIQCLQLNVSNEGFQDVTTRATNAGYITKFADGDAIGVFAVKSDGTIVENINNRKFTLTQGVWELDGDVIEYKGTEFRRFTFYAYYPYSDSPRFEPTAEDPFASMVSRWTVGADQQGDNYTKYDLMTSSASAEGERLQGKVSFTMKHRMALAIIKMPSLTYSFDGTSIEDYVIPGIEPETITVNEAEGSAFYDNASQTYMVLVKPDAKTTISGTYIGAKKMSFSFDANQAGGSAKQYTINDESKISHTLAIGDYFCADGKLVSVESETVPENCIGIVCYVGNPQPHATHPDNYTETNDILFNDYKDVKHGLVLALKNSEYNGAKSAQFHENKNTATTYGDWFYNDEDWVGKFDNCNTANGATVPETRYPAFLGYNNTKLLTMCYEGKGSQSVCNFAYNFITAYREATPIPATTSPWYLPSIVCWNQIANNLSAINRSLAKIADAEQMTSTTNGALTGHYWSSTQRNGTFQWTHAMEGGNYNIICERGSRAGYFRMMLAF